MCLDSFNPGGENRGGFQYGKMSPKMEARVTCRHHTQTKAFEDAQLHEIMVARIETHSI